jgi:hypothetical protein
MKETLMIRLFSAALVSLALICGCSPPEPRLPYLQERAIFDTVCHSARSPRAMAALEPNAVAYLRKLAASRGLADIRAENQGAWSRKRLLLSGRAFAGQPVILGRSIVVQTERLRVGDADYWLALAVDTLSLEAGDAARPPAVELWGFLLDRPIEEREIIDGVAGYFLKTVPFERADGVGTEWAPLLVCHDVDVFCWAKFPADAYARGKDALGMSRAFPLTRPKDASDRRRVLEVAETWLRTEKRFDIRWRVDGRYVDRKAAVAELTLARVEPVFVNIFVSGERTAAEARRIAGEAGLAEAWYEIIPEERGEFPAPNAEGA